MLFELLLNYIETFTFLNVFKYITVRTGLAFFTSLSILIVILSFIGDLIESKFKRINDIKNSGNILPGHGGLFDRFDGMIFIFYFMPIVEYIL